MTDPNTPPSDPGSGGAPPAAPTTPPTAPTTPTTTEGAAWRNMVPAEFRDDPALKDYKDFGSFVKSHVHLNKLVGAEPRVPPAGAPPDLWAKFWSALGRPDTPDQYQITAPEGRTVDDKMMAGFRKAAHDIGLTSSQAAKLAEWHFTSVTEAEDAIAADLAATTERVDRELRREYGQAYENNIRLATKLAQDVGGPELLQWFEKGEGNNPVVIRTFVKLARMMGEDRLGTSRPSDFGRTPAEAQAEIGRLNFDKEFQSALHNSEHPGHVAAVERKAALYRAAFPTEDKP